MSRPFLTIRLSGQELALPISRVREVADFPKVTPVPTLPPCMLGVANLRGQVLPVADLALKFGMAPSPLGRRTCLVVVEPPAAGGVALGLRADSVETLLELSEEELLPPPAFGLPVKLEFIQGLVQQKGRFILALDLERVLDPAELLALEQVPDVRP